MKYALKTIIITIFVGIFSLSPTVFAQTQEELELQYRTLLMQMIVQLQAQVSQQQGGATSSGFVLPPENICGVRYQGNQSITAIQQELLNQGYTITKVDGKIGPETRAAVSAFQSAASAQKVDGLIGNETRNLLAQNSVACVGDSGITVSTSPLELGAGVCQLGYQGDSSTIAVQQELQDQGYTIIKVDGKIGPETHAAVKAFQTNANISVNGLITEEVRIALSRRSLLCDGVVENPTLPPVVIQDPVTENEDVPAPDPAENTTIADIQKTNIIAGVRTTSTGIPDDTAVFTYLMSFNNDGFFYVPTNPTQAFTINILASSGASISVSGIDSIVSSSQKVLRADGTSYFRVKKGDTMSLRTSVQPGSGNYYAELGRFSYTTEDAFTVQNPTMTNYGFNAADWRSGMVTLLN